MEVAKCRAVDCRAVSCLDLLDQREGARKRHVRDHVLGREISGVFSRQGRLLRTLDGRLPPNSVVYILSRRPLDARRQAQP